MKSLGTANLFENATPLKGWLATKLYSMHMQKVRKNITALPWLINNMTFITAAMFLYSCEGRRLCLEQCSEIRRQSAFLRQVTDWQFLKNIFVLLLPTY